MISIGTLRYGNADALKYATVEESLGREHSVRGGKIKLRFVAGDATSFNGDQQLKLKSINACMSIYKFTDQRFLPR